MFPFTFSEAAELCGISKSQEADFFLDYLQWGGLPQRFEFTNEQSRMIYLEDVLNSIVYRDVNGRFKACRQDSDRATPGVPL